MNDEINKFLLAPVLFYMDTVIPKIEYTNTMEDLGKIYRDSNAGCVIINNENNQIVGFVDRKSISYCIGVDKDVTIKYFVKEILGNDSFICISQETSMWNALKILNGENRLGRIFDFLPIVNETTSIACGVLSRDKLLKMDFDNRFK